MGRLGRDQHEEGIRRRRLLFDKAHGAVLEHAVRVIARARFRTCGSCRSR
jgi:hypothetical protein